MSEHDDQNSPQDPSDPMSDAGLDDLRDRLGQLQERVELLGSQGVWPEAPAQPAPGPAEVPYRTPPSGYDPGYGYPAPGSIEPAPDHGRPNPAAGYGQPDPAQGYDPAGPAYGQAPGNDPGPAYIPPSEPFLPPEAPQQPHQPPAQGPPEPAPAPAPAAAPAPVATNGHSKDPAEVSARSTSVALVDAGPFDDLIQLRHFEDELASLNAVRDVRVRRFGHGRASIEVGMTGPYALGRELFRIGREMSVSDGSSGDLIVDLAPPQPIEESPEALEEEETA